MTRDIDAYGLFDILASSAKNTICWFARLAAWRKFTEVYPAFMSIVLLCM
jgi:hypothetical protein